MMATLLTLVLAQDAGVPEISRALAVLEAAQALPTEHRVLVRPSPFALGLYVSASRDTLGQDDADRALEELVDDIESAWQREA